MRLLWSREMTAFGTPALKSVEPSMQLPSFDYVKPSTLEEGLIALRDAEGPVQVLAGGTDVLFNMKLGFFTPKTVINIKALPELKAVTQASDGSIRIGACCRLTDLVDHPLIVEKLPTLAKAIRSVASWHVRNMATLGGNLCLDTRCWYTNQDTTWRNARPPCFKTDGDLCHVIKSSPDCVAINSSDTAPILMCLDAHVSLAKAGSSRDMPLTDFYRYDGLDHTIRQPDEILTSIVVPPCTDKTVFIKIAPREGLDFAVGAIAGRLTKENDKIISLTLVISSLAPAPMILKGAAASIIHSGFTDSAIAAAAEEALDDAGLLTNLFTKVAYKRELIKALVTRALKELRED